MNNYSRYESFVEGLIARNGGYDFPMNRAEMLERFGEDIFSEVKNTEFGGNGYRVPERRETREIVNGIIDYAMENLFDGENWASPYERFAHFGPEAAFDTPVFTFRPETTAVRSLRTSNADPGNVRRSSTSSGSTSTSGTSATTRTSETTTVSETQPAAEIETPEEEVAETTGTPKERKAALEEAIRTHNENISNIQNGTSEAVKNAQDNMKTAEDNMNNAIENDKRINDEVKEKIRGLEAAITEKSTEISNKEAEIAQCESSISQTQGAISNLESALSSLAEPSGKEGDEERDAKLRARKAALESEIAAKKQELEQLNAHKEELNAQKATLEEEKAALESEKNEVMKEELKDASPETKAAIRAYEESRDNVEKVKTSELSKEQEALNASIEELNEVEAEIQKIENLKAQSNFSIDGLLEGAEQVIGDCYLFAALNSLDDSAEGQKILENAIQINEDGTYTVKFDGINWSATFTEAELKELKQTGTYTSSDDDAFLIEAGVEKLLYEMKNGTTTLSDNQRTFLSFDDNMSRESGSPRDIFYLLTGKTPELYGVDNAGSFSDFISTYESDKNENKEQYATISMDADVLNPYYAQFGYSVSGGHGLSIKDVNGEYVTLVDSNLPNYEIVMTRSQLEGSVYDVQYAVL